MLLSMKTVVYLVVWPMLSGQCFLSILSENKKNREVFSEPIKNGLWLEMGKTESGCGPIINSS